MSIKTRRQPVMLCIGCDDGEPDSNGAYTLCAICSLTMAVPVGLRAA